MTPAEVVAAANQRYNSIGDQFFPDEEAYLLLWDAVMVLATEGYLIETPFTTSTAVGTQAYDYPTNAIAILRATYEGNKLGKINQRQDDTLTMFNQATTATGTPQYFFDFGDSFYLRPVPGEIGTLKIWAACRPQPYSSTSATLEIGAEWHMSLVNFLLSEKCLKDKNYQGEAIYRARWNETVAKAQSWRARMKRRGGFAIVTDVDSVPETWMGTV